MMKSKTIQVPKMSHSPTLNTVLMVERVLENMDESVIKVAELKRRLPKQVNHRVLMVILDYLQESNKIFIGTKGITWISEPNPRLKKILRNAFEL